MSKSSIRVGGQGVSGPELVHWYVSDHLKERDEPEVSVSFLRAQSGQARRAASSRYLHSRVADADEPSAVKRVAIAL